VANYNVNLDVKVRAQQLKQFNKDIIQTRREVKKTTDNLKQIERRVAKGLAPSLNNLNTVLAAARRNFANSSRGANGYANSLTQLANAEKMVRQEQSKSMFDLNKARKTANKTERDAEAARLRRLREERRLRKQINQEQAIFLAGQSQAVTTQGFLPGGNFGIAGGQIGPRLPLGNRLGFGSNATGGPFAMQGGAMGRLKGGMGSAMIGGGFPLLFGAGGLSSAMGGIAGGIGGALAPGGGFAASIAATAMAAQIEKARAFDKAIKDLNRSIEATGGKSVFTAKQVNEFAKSMRMTKEEALEALKAFEQFGAASRVSLLRIFGDESTFGMLSSLKDNASILNNMEQLSKQIGFEQAEIVLQILKTQGARAAENKILEFTINKSRKLTVEEEKRVGAVGRLRKIRKEEANAKEEDFQKDVRNAQILLELQKQRTEEQRRQSIIKAPVDELNKMLDPLYQIDALGKNIGSSFSESFKGIVSGSMTAQDALRNLFMRTADHFADMAAQILANQIRSGIFGLFSSFLTPSFSTTGGASIPTGTGTYLGSVGQMPSNPGSMGPNIVPQAGNVRGSAFQGKRASGGPVMGGGSYLVGERGPEMFSPGVSGMISPNHALGGGTNVVVNVDASGSSVEGDEDRGRELGRLISVAVQSELVQQKRPGGLLA